MILSRGPGLAELPEDHVHNQNSNLLQVVANHDNYSQGQRYANSEALR